MPILLSASSLLAVAFIIHVFLWKIRLPKNQIGALLQILVAVLASWTVAAWLLTMPLATFLHSSLFFISASLCYVITYSAVEGDSPTLSLMRFLAEKKSEGCSEEEIMAFLARRPFIRTRLAALLNSSLVREESGRYFPAAKPSLPFQLILGFRKVFGAIPKGG